MQNIINDVLSVRDFVWEDSANCSFDFRRYDVRAFDWWKVFISFDVWEICLRRQWKKWWCSSIQLMKSIHISRCLRDLLETMMKKMSDEALSSSLLINRQIRRLISLALTCMQTLRCVNFWLIWSNFKDLTLLLMRTLLQLAVDECCEEFFEYVDLFCFEFLNRSHSSHLVLIVVTCDKVVELQCICFCILDRTLR